jgi:hypothetical protein
MSVFDFSQVINVTRFLRRLLPLHARDRVFRH